ncbi:DMT family transporter [Herbaspirillum sp. C7C2]|uniref:DMT family transporter n=1 Tax=Herbaspirillum sp. C7C2 TaxID=2736666 RepID=UPI00313F1BF7
MVAIVIGAVVLSLPRELSHVQIWPSLAILGACFAWGIDNNLTRKVSTADGSWVASVKGLSAGLTNLVIAIAMNARLPNISVIAETMALGFLSYGVSLTLFVVALRHLGTARTGTYFSAAPFLGAVLALASGEALTPQLLIAGALMAFGIYLHLTERHAHEHTHEVMEHEHEHTHDDLHHAHTHDAPMAPGTKHTHKHHQSRITHTRSLPRYTSPAPALMYYFSSESNKAVSRRRTIHSPDMISGSCQHSARSGHPTTSMFGP